MEGKQLAGFFETFKKRHPSGLALCMCCTAALVSETVTYPLDMLKTRLQVFGELQGKSAHPGVFRLGLSILRNEGILQLWQGLSPALVRHLIYTGARVPIYEYIRRDVFHLPPAAHFTVKRHEPDDAPSKEEIEQFVYTERNFGFIVRAALAGMIAGGVAQLLASPTDLMKVRLQTERKWQSEAYFHASKTGNSALRPESRVPPRSGLVSTFKQLLAEGGVRGLWRGGLPNVQRAALINMGELTTYDAAKRWFAVQFQLEDCPLLHCCASATSGFVSAIVGTPADMIKTRIMHQRAASSTAQQALLYTGVVDCARKVIRAEGVLSLYKGFFLIWARMAPWSLSFWLTYEKIRIFIGVGGF